MPMHVVESSTDLCHRGRSAVRMIDSQKSPLTPQQPSCVNARLIYLKVNFLVHVRHVRREKAGLHSTAISAADS